MATSVEIGSKHPFRVTTPEDASELYRSIQRQIQEHPYRTLAVAAGVGFVLGGGLLSRATGRLVATGLRVGMSAVIAPMAAQMVHQVLGARAGRNEH